MNSHSRKAIRLPTVQVTRRLSEAYDSFRASPAKRQLLADAGWVASGQVVTAVGVFVGMRLLTEFVAPTVFGVVSLLVGTLTFASTAFCLPQLQAALRFYPELAPQGRGDALRRIIGRSLFRTTGWIAVVILSVGLLFHSALEISMWAFVCLAALFVSETFRTLETNLLSAARQQRPFAIWTALESCCRPLLAILVIYWLGSTPQSVLLGYLLATGGILLLFKLGHRSATPEASPDLDDARLSRELWQYALPLAPLAVVAWISSLGDRYVIGGVLSLEAVGLYAAAYGLTSRLLATIPGAFLFLTLRPVYFQAVSEGNRRLERKTLNLWLLSAVMISMLLVLVTIWISKPLVSLLLAPSYASCWTLMPILATAFALMGWSQILNTVSLAYKQSKNVLISEAAAAITMLVCVFPATVSLGLAGAAIATFLAYAVQLSAAYLLARPYLMHSKHSGRMAAC